jgi:hypothetical protein
MRPIVPAQADAGNPRLAVQLLARLEVDADAHGHLGVSAKELTPVADGDNMAPR